MTEKTVDHNKKEGAEEKIREIGEEMRKKILIALCLLLAAFISFSVLAPWLSSPKHHARYINTLDNKKAQVQELTAAVTATSVAITMLPGDAATPVATKLADMGQYLLIVLCAIYLEKYLITVMGLVTFKYIIPLALSARCVGVVSGRDWLKRLALKAMALGIALYLVIPVSLRITDLIEATYAGSIEAALESAEKSAEVIGAPDEDKAAAEEAAIPEEEEQESLLDKVMNLPDTIAGTAAEIVDSVTRISEEKVKELEAAMNQFMESVAVMIITSCVIPILVLLFFIMLIRGILDSITVLPDPVPARSGKRRRRTSAVERAQE